MRLKVAIKQKNDEFNQEYADQYNFGEESINNEKYKINNSFDFTTNIDSLKLLENQELIIEGTKKENETEIPLKIQLNNMAVLECHKNGQIYEMYAVSQDFIIRSIKSAKEKHNKTYFTFYLKDRNDFENFGHNFYALKKDIKILNN